MDKERPGSVQYLWGIDEDSNISITLPSDVTDGVPSCDSAVRLEESVRLPENRCSLHNSLSYSENSICNPLYQMHH